MKKFLSDILGNTDGPIEITCFSIWHFLYIFLIAGVIIGAAFWLKGKSDATKHKTLKILALVTFGFYVVDFFLQPFVRSSFTLNIDKLPFHICTLMGVMAIFVADSKHDWFREIIVALATTGAFMYLVYPGSALGDNTPWCYKVVQTMLYHGLLLAWGILSLTTGQVKLHIKKIWLPLVGMLCVALWATIGNVCYNTNYAGGSGHYDWFFLTGSTFGMSPYLMPFLTLAAFYSVTAIIYGIYWLSTYLMAKRAAKRTAANN